MKATATLVVACLVACNADEPDTPTMHIGNAELGIASIEMRESDTQLAVIGLDEGGQIVAHLELEVGHVELPDEELAGLGRTLAVGVHGVDERHASVGLAPIALPETGSAIDVFLRDPLVADALARWDVTLAPPEPASFVGDLAYAHGGTCTSFVPPCQGTPFTACCLEDAKSIGGFESVSEQYVVCGNLSPKTRAIRNCKGAGAITSCGTAGPAGCAVCWSASYAARPNFGTKYVANEDACEWITTDFMFLKGLTESPPEQDARKPDLPS